MHARTLAPYTETSDASTQKVVDKLVPMVERFIADPRYELEASLGTCSFGKPYSTGVEFMYFNDVIGNFVRSEKTWSLIEKRIHFADFHYVDNVRIRYLATRSDSASCLVRKRKVSTVDLKNTNFTSDRYRISLNIEENSNADISQNIPTYVRLHERWSFTYQNAWRYDFSKVASGTTKESACNSEPVFEIEIELLRNSEYLRTRSPRAIACSLVAKLRDLCTIYNTDASGQTLTKSAPLVSVAGSYDYGI